MGGGLIFIENPRGVGGSPGEGGAEGSGGCLRRIGELGGGGGLNVFFVAELATKSKTAQNFPRDANMVGKDTV